MYLDIDLKNQGLTVYQAGKPLCSYFISSAKNGVGEQRDTGCTPRGWHTVRAMIGQDCPENTVFVARRPTGEIFTPALQVQYPDRDWILTRILWLSGMEPGHNRLGRVDTMRRYIYIHGVPDSTELGRPNSKGCIRISNKDMLELFQLVQPGTRVFIHE